MKIFTILFYSFYILLMLVELAVRAVKNGNEQTDPRCSDTWQFPTTTCVSQFEPTVL